MLECKCLYEHNGIRVKGVDGKGTKAKDQGRGRKDTIVKGVGCLRP
jgi:hypothetical protein